MADPVRPKALVLRQPQQQRVDLLPAASAAPAQVNTRELIEAICRASGDVSIRWANGEWHASTFMRGSYMSVNGSNVYAALYKLARLVAAAMGG